MSWSVNVTGSRAGVLAYLDAEMPKMASNYQGKPECDDILSCHLRAKALVEALDLSGTGPYDANAVTVEGIGSHSSTTAGLANASFSLKVTRVRLAI